MIVQWLNVPLTLMLLSTITILSASAFLLVFLSFGPWTGRFVQSFRGVAAPFFNAVTVTLGILIGFLASDVWDRTRRAAAVTRSEADGLVSVYRLAAAFDMPLAALSQAIRAYATAVASKEWPRMANGESAPEAEAALDALLRVTVHEKSAQGDNPQFDRAMLDAVMAVKANRNTRLALSEDESAPLKWIAVVTLAVLTQISLAAVHLEKPRPQIAAMVIYTASLIFVIGLLAVHEVPFVPPLVVSPEPIAHVLDLVPQAGPATGAERQP